jgi:lipopolysaccharide export LptBFGC system permease protein LptF
MINKKVFDVSGGKDVEGQRVWIWGRHNKANQRWRIAYADKHKKEKGKGYNRDYGFYITRPFYFRSRMPMQRVAERVGSDVRLRRWRKNQKQQQFFFDITSKTIKSQNSKSWSLEIPNKGRNNQLRMTTTNSRWW